MPNSVGHLILAGGDVSALEIFAGRVSAARVVLASCGSALAGDTEGATSLVAAFIAGGAAQVVATLRPVSDRGSEELTQLFYRDQGADDPVRTLAKVQRELAGTNNVDWPYFAVFGQATCRTTP
jgi:CHAT domain-containing protein